jgi:PBS lyase HEAT-like repeat-containing protein
MSRVCLALTLAFLLGAPAFVAGDEIEGRFYPEKGEYLVGEPVYIVFEVVNGSSKDVVASIPSGHLNCGDEGITQYEVLGAKPSGFGPDGCCDRPATDVCDNVAVRLRPGQGHSERFILNYWYNLDKPGTYQAHLVHDVQFKPPTPGVSTRDEDFFAGSHRELPISSAFPIVLVQGSPGALKQAFERVTKDLKSKDPQRVGWAGWAVVYLAPANFEPLVQSLARINPYGEVGGNMWYPVDGVDGLARLNTASARRTLSYLAEHKERPDAVEALGKTGDRSYLPLLIRLCRNPNLAQSSDEAIGMLGGDDAIRFLVSQLRSAGAIERQDAARGLGYTGDREGVRPLVEALYDPVESVRSAAQEGLGRLTHRTPGAFHACGLVPPPPPPNPGEDPWPRQQAWWKANADRVAVYRWNDCGPTLPLD